MHARYFGCTLIAAAMAHGGPRSASAQTPMLDERTEPTRARVAEQPSLPETEARVEHAQTGKGLLFFPSVPELHAFRVGVGGLYDAVDPQVMYGVEVRVPQFTADARYGLGDGWSIKGHFNSMWVTNELLFGASVAGRSGPWSLEGTASVGVYFGKLARFNFDAAMVSPEYRPELSVGYDFGKIAVSLRGSLLLMGPERVRVGGVWGGFDNSNLFVGHSEMIYVENPTGSGGAWYFGLGSMTTRAYYQFWVLFPDSPELFTYPRAVAGYEF